MFIAFCLDLQHVQFTDLSLHSLEGKKRKNSNEFLSSTIFFIVINKKY